jgi:hypothetical protein
MEIPSEVITEFFALKKSKKFNVVITVFSTLISGFIIILGVKPEYFRDFSTFKIVLLSIAIIAPLYLFNQILSIFLVSRTSKLGLKKLFIFAKLPKDSHDSVDEFTGDFANDIAAKAICKSPARQAAEISTIISSYLAAFIGWKFNIGIIAIYTFLIIFSILSMLSVYWVLKKMILSIEPKHLKPLVEKLKKDKEFMVHLEERLDRIENLAKKNIEDT